MRLSEKSVNAVKDAVRSAFPGQARVILFGSRFFDDRRGGDIDLLVISDLPQGTREAAKIKAIVKMQMALGDQKIDVVVTADPARDSRPVVKEALLNGVEL
ncbi:MAG: nucleotidyltransferase domain-containing protein [Syntrophobacterales bacterium]|nr:nucleotidyltransferase domain-containing protein [Syntrophobacterales bacterium]